MLLQTIFILAACASLVEGKAVETEVLQGNDAKESQSSIESAEKSLKELEQLEKDATKESEDASALASSDGDVQTQLDAEVASIDDVVAQNTEAEDAKGSTSAEEDHEPEDTSSDDQDSTATNLDNIVQEDEPAVENDALVEKRAIRREYSCPPKSCIEVRQRNRNARTGYYNIWLSGRMEQVFCEMKINGGGYTFLNKYTVSRLSSTGLAQLFRNKRDVLLRFNQPNGNQQYTVVRPYRSNYMSVQLSTYSGYVRPVNEGLKPYLYLGLTPGRYSRRNRAIYGFYSNNRRVQYRNCGRNGQTAPNFFAFYSNLRNRAASNYHKNNLVYERQGVAVDWRRTGIVNCASKVPNHYFMLTEMHFGGCGAYTSSDRWRTATVPALGAAIGIR